MDCMQSNTTDEYVVYVIQNMIDDQCYVGMTKNPKQRWRSHQKRSCNEHLRNAITKYGVEKFEFAVIERWKTLELAYDAERDIIHYLRTLGACLYNANDGGLGGCIPTESTLEKIRKAYRRDEETLRKRASSIRYAKADPIKRAHYSESARKVNGTQEARLRHHENAVRLWATPEYREKQSKSICHELRSTNSKRIHNDEKVQQSKCVKMSALTEEQARKILFELSHVTIQDLSLQFNVSYKVIRSLLLRKTWKHLK